MSSNHIAWLLEEDGTVTPVYGIQKAGWPGSMKATLADGSIRRVSLLNLMSRDDLGKRYDSTKTPTPAA